MNNPTPKVRVAALQFCVTEDVAANLQTGLQLIDAVASFKPALLVLPACCNHSAWYRDRATAQQVAVALDGPFVAAIAAKAVEHRCYIKFHVMARRAEGEVMGADLLLDPTGSIINNCWGSSDQQTALNDENDFVARAHNPGPIVETSAGRLGICADVDGLLPATARAFALGGAQILVNSLNSLGTGEASRNTPTYAAENRVFVIAANQVYEFVPPELRQAVADRLGVAVEQLQGGGASQIVAPDGKVLAQAPPEGKALLVVDLDLAQTDAAACEAAQPTRE